MKFVSKGLAFAAALGLSAVAGAVFCFRGYLALRSVIAIWGGLVGFLLGPWIAAAVTPTAGTRRASRLLKAPRALNEPVCWVSSSLSETGSARPKAECAMIAAAPEGLSGRARNPI